MIGGPWNGGMTVRREPVWEWNDSEEEPVWEWNDSEEPVWEWNDSEEPVWEWNVYISLSVAVSFLVSSAAFFF